LGISSIEKSVIEFRDRLEFGNIDHQLFTDLAWAPLDEAIPEHLTLPLGADFGFACEGLGLCDV
jgi:hypothetical protein